MPWDFHQLFILARAKGDRGIAAAIGAVDEYGEMVLDRAQQLAPVGGGSHSPRDPAPGTLAASATATPAKLQGGKIVKVIGFNTVYAAVQHENLDFGHDQGQAKYLETAMRESSPQFLPFLAGRVQQA